VEVYFFHNQMPQSAARSKKMPNTTQNGRDNDKKDDKRTPRDSANDKSAKTAKSGSDERKGSDRS
jgi:hypothetical protein